MRVGSCVSCTSLLIVCPCETGSVCLPSPLILTLSNIILVIWQVRRLRILTRVHFISGGVRLSCLRSEGGLTSLSVSFSHNKSGRFIQLSELVNCVGNPRWLCISAGVFSHQTPVIVCNLIQHVWIAMPQSHYSGQFQQTKTTFLNSNL